MAVPVPAKQGADAGEKLVQREWLGQIVVSAVVETLDDVFRGRTGRKHENRAPHALRAQCTQHFKAILLWQEDVEEDQIEITGESLLLPGLAVSRDLDIVSFGGQSFLDEASDLRLIFDKEYVHEKLAAW
jgi:hypothetical protein